MSNKSLVQKVALWEVLGGRLMSAVITGGRSTSVSPVGVFQELVENTSRLVDGVAKLLDTDLHLQAEGIRMEMMRSIGHMVASHYEQRRTSMSEQEMHRIVQAMEIVGESLMMAEADPDLDVETLMRRRAAEQELLLPLAQAFAEAPLGPDDSGLVFSHTHEVRTLAIEAARTLLKPGMERYEIDRLGDATLAGYAQIYAAAHRRFAADEQETVGNKAKNILATLKTIGQVLVQVGAQEAEADVQRLIPDWRRS